MHTTLLFLSDSYMISKKWPQVSTRPLDVALVTAASCGDERGVAKAIIDGANGEYLYYKADYSRMQKCLQPKVTRRPAAFS